ncbi:MAG: site-specific integrase [Hydrogenophaga sp.]|nr:site-specific integrase [Hydrogenophaga sp.]
MTLTADLRRPGAAPEGDHNPLFGPPLITSPPVFELDAWALRHRVPTLTHHLWLATSSPRRALFSHTFEFLVQADTQAVLLAWKGHSDQAGRLLRVSHAAQRQFPPLPKPEVAGRVKATFNAELKSCPLALLLACPAPDIAGNPAGLLALAAQRVLLLIRALAQAEQRYAAGPVINDVSTQMRLALDSKANDPEKLALFLKLPNFSADFSSYCAGLANDAELQIAELKELSGAGESTERKTLRRIRDLAAGHLGDPIPLDNRSHEVNLIKPPVLPARIDLGPLDVEIPWAPIVSAKADDLENSGDEEPTGIEVTEYDRPVPPELQYRLGKGHMLQTQADRNLLPYAWNRLRPDEIDGLRVLLAELLGSAEDALLGAFAHLALLARCSIETVSNMVLGSDATTSAWTLDIEGARLLRRIVQPTEGSIAAEKEPPLRKPYPGWIRPLANVQVLDLSPALVVPLRQALAAKPNALALGKLWPTEEEETAPWTAFNQRCAKTRGLERVTQGLLGHTAEQVVFDETNSAVMARMLLVPAHAVKPAAGWYASWSLGEANRAMACIAPGGVVTTPSQGDDHNGLGSGIDPDDERLRAAFSQAQDSLINVMAGNGPGGWIELHNQITTYSVVVLLACTGARPVSSVFERAADFDLERGRLFVDDKAISNHKQDRWGRLVPLPGLVKKLIEGLYRPYLYALLESLRSTGQIHLQPLINAIDGQLQGKPDCALPYFFHLRQVRDGALEIREVDESGLAEGALFDWPLPWNLFRHRMATRLRSFGLDEELVAAQLGHTESGAATYGDFSTRCWEQDETPWREKLANAIAPLRIEPPTFTSSQTRIPITSVARVALLSNFGSAKRLRARQDTRRQALREARTYLLRRLSEWADDPKLAHAADGKPEKGASDEEALPLDRAEFLKSIDPERWTELGRRMLFNDKDTPRANASIWYEAYEELAERIHERYRVRLRSKFAARQHLLERPAFHEDCIGITKRLGKLRNALDEAFKSAPPASKMSHSLKELLLAFDLCLSARVTDSRFLLRLTSKNSGRLRYHIRKNVAYIGFHPERTDDDGLPFAWFILPERSFGILLKLKEGEQSSRDSSAAKGLLAPFLNELGVKATGDYRVRAIEAIAHLVECENAIVLPGIAAASRSSRLPSWSLSAQELARVQFGRLIAPLSDVAASADVQDPEDEEEEDEDPAEDVAELYSSGVEASTEENQEEPYDFSYPYVHDGRGSEEVTRTLLRKVREAFAGFKVAIPKDKSPTSEVISGHRASVAGKISEALKIHGKDCSSAAQILVAWILELLCNKRASGRWLKARSVLRYLDALSVGFVEYSCELDLFNADEIEIEMFYDRVLRRPHVTKRSNDKEPLTQRLKNQRYILARLMDFHRFAEKEYGVDSPDWSALGADLTGSMVSAHVITPTEYHLALQSLCPRSVTFDREATLDAFVLLLGYRFGLRASEAISLARSDWVTTSGACVVVISARHRSTKSFAGRRQIPLMGTFSDHEQLIVESWLKHWELFAPKDPNAPLFFSEVNPKIPTQVQPHRTRIVSTLRAVCSNDSVTFHHARHSFANLLALRLIFPELLDTYPAFAFDELWDARQTSLQLLKHDKPTRRAAWALAATLGHAHPQTTFHHYTHLLHDWANVHCQKANPRAFEAEVRHRIAERKFDIERCDADPAYPLAPPPRAAAVYAQLTPRVALDAMKLCGRAVKLETVAWQLRLSPLSSARLQEAFTALQAHKPTRKPDLVRKAKAARPREPRSQYARLVLNRPQTSWNRIDALVGFRAPLGTPESHPCDQVADARQILVFSDEHLIQINRFLACIGWSKDDVDVYEPDGYGLTMPAAARAHGFKVIVGRDRSGKKPKKVKDEKSEDTKPAQGSKKKQAIPAVVGVASQRVEPVFQVEVAKVRIKGQPRLLDQIDRLAIVPATRNDEPIEACSDKAVSRPEFVLIWLALHLAT